MSLASAAAPANDSFANAIPLTGSSVLTNGSNVGATKEPGEPNHAGDAGGRSIWWSWASPFTGSVILRTAGSSFDTLLAVYTGQTISALTLIAANDQDQTDPLGGDTSRVKFNATVGTLYFIAVDGYSAASGQIILEVVPPPRPPNDNFSERTLLTGSTLSVSGNNFDATVEAGESAPVADAGKSVWWTWTAPVDGTTTITTLGSDFDTTLYVGIGEAIDDLTLIAGNDQDPVGGSTSRVTFVARAGVRYQIAVDGWNGEEGEIILNLQMPPAPPILAPPRFINPSVVQVTVFGAPEHSYAIEACENLGASWRALATNVMGSTGTWEFSETNAGGTRFYRALLRD